MHAQLHPLLDTLAAQGDAATTGGWNITPLAGGANNKPYRATGELGDIVVKFTRRDERDRAGREYAALRLLQERAPGLAPRPVLLDRERYARPVVVQTWIPGDMVQEPPHSDAEWTAWLECIARVHAIGLGGQDDLLPCWENGNGSTGYAATVEALRQATIENDLPAETRQLVERLAKLPLGGWPEAEPRLCRADHNTRNFMRDTDGLRLVDWEYSGWGDPLEDLAELMTHVTYMEVPHGRWQEVAAEYARLRGTDGCAERLRICLAIKAVGWSVRLARFLAKKKGPEARGAWRTDTPKKHAYYLDRIRDDPMLEMLRA